MKYRREGIMFLPKTASEMHVAPQKFSSTFNHIHPLFVTLFDQSQVFLGPIYGSQSL